MIEKMNEHKASIDGAKILEFVNNHKTATFAEIHRHFNFGEDVSMKEIHAALYRASEDADLKQSQFVRDLIEVQRELISARRKVAALLRQL